MSVASTEDIAISSSTRRALAQPGEELLTVIIPVYNEAATVDELLHKVLAAPYQKQIVVVDDGSTDQTPLILEAWKGHPQVEILYHPYNRGKGAAIRTALDHARGRFVIVQDADLEYDPQDYPCLIEPLLRGQAQVVYGSRYLRRHKAGRRPISLFRYGVSVLNLCVRLIYGVRLSDEATCYKAFPTSLLRRLDLQCERFEFCPEVTAKICRLGCRILEVPIHYDPRTVQAGKKIRWRDGWEALATLWKWRRWQGQRSALRLLTPARRTEFIPFLRSLLAVRRPGERNEFRSTRRGELFGVRKSQ